VIIADRGVLSEPLLEELEGEGMEYKERESIVAMLQEQLSQSGLSGLVNRKGWDAISR
jgi:hypothetical protein